ncbi:hypothetical protein [Pseudovibrio sp. FO-BEG1]|uniref:hypothetical protein n=1 Tax=Pseudovibrio sp. (strain FO-BEG1) TaxID=911045 RepID=UPI0005A04F49|nr:hypothetical protein [Pseudovibrio sp. FO-BEG1]
MQPELIEEPWAHINPGQIRFRMKYDNEEYLCAITYFALDSYNSAADETPMDTFKDHYANILQRAVAERPDKKQEIDGKPDVVISLGAKSF